MASSPITSWQIDGETVANFIYLGSKIIADGDCSHEIKRHLLLGRKVTTISPLHGKWTGKQWKQWLTLFFWAPKSLQMVTAAMKLKDAYSLEEKL